MSQHDVAVVMHIDEELSDDQIHRLEQNLSNRPGVMSACVHESARHLMLIDYDPEIAVSTELLAGVRSEGLHAELVGF